MPSSRCWGTGTTPNCRWKSELAVAILLRKKKMCRAILEKIAAIFFSLVQSVSVCIVYIC